MVILHIRHNTLLPSRCDSTAVSSCTSATVLNLQYYFNKWPLQGDGHSFKDVSQAEGQPILLWPLAWITRMQEKPKLGLRLGYLILAIIHARHIARTFPITIFRAGRPEATPPPPGGARCADKRPGTRTARPLRSTPRRHSNACWARLGPIQT